jgi:hypothetical protein
VCMDAPKDRIVLAVHAPVRVWAVCAAALEAGRVVPGVPRARREDDAGVLLIGCVAGSVEDVESRSIPWQ